MNNPHQNDTAAIEQKITALVEQLRLAERELQELTGGPLGASKAPESSPILLREAAQHQTAEMQMAILNALPAHIALLDDHGVILAVNEAWRRFATANILQSPDFLIGQNYLGVFEGAHGDCAEEARSVAVGIRRVLRGELKDFSLEYPCHSPTEQRWFKLMVTPLSELPGQGAVVMHVNVTERRSAEESLRKNQAWLEAEARRLHESQAVANVGSWETDLDTMEVTWTAETHRIFGTEPALFAPTHDSFLERVHPADREAVNTVFAESLDKAGPFTFVHRLVLPDGSVKFVEDRWQTFTDAAGKPVRAVGTCQDITERKLAEEMIQTRARQQETIAKLGCEATRATSLDGIFETCVRMVATALDVKLCQVLKLSPGGSELRLVSGIGWNPGLVGTATVAVDFESQAGFTLQTGGTVYVNDFTVETRFKLPPLLQAHDVVSGLSVAIMLRDKPWGVLGAHCRSARQFNEEDAHFMQSVATLLSVVIERLAVQRSLSESDRRMRDAQRLANLGNWELDLLKSRLTWSDEVFRILGAKLENFPESFEAFMSFVHPEDRSKVEAAQEIALSGIGPLEVEHRIIRPDGTVRHVLERGELIQDEMGNAVALSGTVLDVTDLRMAQDQAANMSALLTEAQRMANLGSWDMDETTGRLTWSEDTSRLFGIKPGDFGGTYESFVQFLLPEDRAALDAAHDRASENGGLLESEYRIRRADGEVRWMFERGRLLFAPNGVVTRRMGVVMDITERKLGERVQVWETQVLEAVSSGQSLPAILANIAEGVEDAIPGAMASILLLDEDGEHLRHGAAPHLPEAYSKAVDGVKVGPMVGSCGTAAHRREPVFVTDIQNDPLWQDFRELAEQHGLRACWSLPVLNAAGRVLATFAVYYHEPRDPQPGDIALIKRMVHITGIAVERVRKEKALRLLETCVSRLHDIVLITDAEPIDESGPRILFVNDAFVRRTGYTREEVIGKSPRFLQGPKTQRDALDRIRTSLKSWKPVREQLINYTKSGEEFWAELYIVPVADDTGRYTHWVSIERDITERKHVEEALQASEEEFRNLAEAMPQIVWITRPDGWASYFNQHWMDYTGMTPEQSLGQGWITALHPDDQQVAWDAWNKATSELEPYAIEYRLQRADGDFRWWLARGEPQKDAAGLVLKWFGTCTDIHDLKVAELEIVRTNRALKLLSGCSEALIHADDETTLLRDVCQLAVDTGGYRMAWVGYAQDDEKRSITPMAHAGVEEGYLAEAVLTWDEQSRSGQGPAGRVIRSDGPIVCEDIENDASVIWFDAARARGYRAITCLPLRDKQRTFGLLALYSAEVNFTPAEELKLLQEMADDLAFGILNLRARAEQRRTHEAVLTMARGISASTGNEFFEKLAISMVEALGAQAGFIAQLNDDKTMATTLCMVVEGKIVPNFEYALSGTPCEDLDCNDVWVVPKDLQQHYPQAQKLQDLGVNAYIGTELYGADGKLCGQMSVLFREPLEEHEFITSTLKIFASRAAGELERQKTDARLREQAALLDKAQDAILVRDLNHKILYWNQSAERLYGWTAEEAVGRTALELIYHDTTAPRAALKVLMAEGEWVGEIQQFTKDGKPLTVEGRWSLVRDEQGRPKSVLAINTDITERKKIEAQYLRAQRMESIGTLAGGIAHDLNNVLAPIMMSIDLLKMQETNPMRLSVLNTIEGSAKRGADMVKQVLSFARGVEGQQLEVQVAHLMREIEKITNETFLKNIEVHCDVPLELWLVKGDPTQLHQVLLNLCVNARDAMPNGGRLSLTASNLMLDEQYVGMNIDAKLGPYVCIQVEDSGIGIPPDVIERIFEPFFTTKELGKGTGLGLSTTIAIIKSHGGFMRVYSEVGMGTRFHIYLPAQTEPGAIGFEAHEPELPRGNGELVLVIDDEVAVRQITRQTLEAFGYRVLLASDGVEATSIFATRQQEIDVVLTDMMMPLMDGPATIAVLLRMKPGLRIIAASGLNANGMVAKATNAGVKHFIPKPYTAETLLKTICEVLNDHPMP
jgi:PAS domain S-box-containing protein